MSGVKACMRSCSHRYSLILNDAVMYRAFCVQNPMSALFLLVHITGATEDILKALSVDFRSNDLA